MSDRYGVLIEDSTDYAVVEGPERHIYGPSLSTSREAAEALAVKYRGEDDGGHGIEVSVVRVTPELGLPPKGDRRRLYIAGPMTGRVEWNFPAFRRAAEELRAAGYDVVSPHELDEGKGFDPKAPVADFTHEHLLAALRRDCEAVLASDGVAMLPGWELSRGASAEFALAHAARIPARGVAAWLALAQTQEAPRG